MSSMPSQTPPVPPVSTSTPSTSAAAAAGSTGWGGVTSKWSSWIKMSEESISCQFAKVIDNATTTTTTASLSTPTTPASTNTSTSTSTPPPLQSTSNAEKLKSFTNILKSSALTAAGNTLTAARNVGEFTSTILSDDISERNGNSGYGNGRRDDTKVSLILPDGHFDVGSPLDAQALNSLKTTYITSRMITSCIPLKITHTHPYSTTTDKSQSQSQTQSFSSSSTRNTRSLSKLLETRHPNKYILINISESPIPPQILNIYFPTAAGCIDYTFPGMPAPGMGVVVEVCYLLDSYLKSTTSSSSTSASKEEGKGGGGNGGDGVVVFLCGSGMGRSVFFGSCLLTFFSNHSSSSSNASTNTSTSTSTSANGKEETFTTVNKSLSYISEIFNIPTNVLTIPSQRRYMKYFQNVLDGVRPAHIGTTALLNDNDNAKAGGRNSGRIKANPIILKRILLSHVPSVTQRLVSDNGEEAEAETEWGCNPYVQIFRGGVLLYTSYPSASVSPATNKHKHHNNNNNGGGDGWRASSSSSSSSNGGVLTFDFNAVVCGDLLVRFRHSSSTAPTTGGKGNTSNGKSIITLFRIALNTGYIPIRQSSNSSSSSNSNSNSFSSSTFNSTNSSGTGAGSGRGGGGGNGGMCVMRLGLDGLDGITAQSESWFDGSRVNRSSSGSSSSSSGRGGGKDKDEFHVDLIFGEPSFSILRKCEDLNTNTNTNTDTDTDDSVAQEDKTFKNAVEVGGSESILMEGSRVWKDLEVRRNRSNSTSTSGSGSNSNDNDKDKDKDKDKGEVGGNGHKSVTENGASLIGKIRNVGNRRVLNNNKNDNSDRNDNANGGKASATEDAIAKHGNGSGAADFFEVFSIGGSNIKQPSLSVNANTNASIGEGEGVDSVIGVERGGGKDELLDALSEFVDSDDDDDDSGDDYGEVDTEAGTGTGAIESVTVTENVKPKENVNENDKKKDNDIFAEISPASLTETDAEADSLPPQPTPIPAPTSTTSMTTTATSPALSHIAELNVPLPFRDLTFETPPPPSKLIKAVKTEVNINIGEVSDNVADAGDEENDSDDDDDILDGIISNSTDKIINSTSTSNENENDGGNEEEEEEDEDMDLDDFEEFLTRAG